MTNEEAIILLKDCIRIFENGKDRTAEKALVYLEQHIEALNMAIYALEQKKENEVWKLGYDSGYEDAENDILADILPIFGLDLSNFKKDDKKEDQPGD